MKIIKSSILILTISLCSSISMANQDEFLSNKQGHQAVVKALIEGLVPQSCTLEGIYDSVDEEYRYSTDKNGIIKLIAADGLKSTQALLAHVVLINHKERGRRYSLNLSERSIEELGAYIEKDGTIVVLYLDNIIKVEVKIKKGQVISLMSDLVDNDPESDQSDLEFIYCK